MNGTLGSPGAPGLPGTPGTNGTNGAPGVPCNSERLLHDVLPFSRSEHTCLCLQELQEHRALPDSMAPMARLVARVSLLNPP